MLDVTGRAAFNRARAGAAGATPPDRVSCLCSHGAQPISRLLIELAEAWPAERVTLGDLILAFGDRSYGLLILLLSIPNLIPILIPGWAQIFGVPLTIITWQMMRGHPVPRLPAALSHRSISRADLLLFATKAEPWLKRVERFVRPREGWLTGPGGDRLIGILSLYVAAMVMLPGPGTNAPPSFGAAIMAVGLLERDGRTIAIGMVATILGCAFATAIVVGLFWLLFEGASFIL